MCERILDSLLIARVKECSPKLRDIPLAEAKLVVDVLIANSTTERANIGMDSASYWWMFVSEISEQLTGMSCKVVGMVLRGMGLTMNRKNQGFRVAWNEKQLKLINGYLIYHLNKNQQS